MQSVFWNISTYDKHFHNGLFKEFYYPDGTQCNWESISKLQQFFHNWFRIEREKKLLTFPVVTQASIHNGNRLTDRKYENFIARELSLGGDFFLYTSDSADSLSSCCRLRNEMADNTFSYTLGAGGVMSGSKSVISINMNRIAQKSKNIHSMILNLKSLVSEIQLYHYAYNENLKKLKKEGMLPVFDAGYITIDKQYLTIGLNGLLESAEYWGFEISNNEEYKDYLVLVLSTIKELNSNAKKELGCMFNSEIVPGESLGVKFSKWDKESGLSITRDVYNSYFYRVEDEYISTFDKMILHGKDVIKYADGGSAFHDNEDSLLSEKQYKAKLKALVKTGCNFWCRNVPRTGCNDCGHINPNHEKYCIKCGSTNVKYATRVIGYLKFVESFSEMRQKEELTRSYKRGENDKIS
jgi:ribonucleoside-triphosphate reductase